MAQASSEAVKGGRELGGRDVIRDEYRCLIGGELVGALSGETVATHNPATGEKLADVPNCAAADVDRAVAAAHAAYPAWRRLTPVERAVYVRKFAARLRERAETYAWIDSLDLGSPLQAMRKDVASAAALNDFYAGLAPEIKGETIPATATTLNFTIREPYGVVGRIIPFNHPIMFAARIAAPLIAGNTLVMKPPEQTPLSALEMARDVREIFPAGVVNIINGDGLNVGAPLVRHPLVRRVHFTGSVEIGREVAKAAAEGLKPVSLELGGKNPMIVFPDADIDKAVAGAFNGMNYCWSQGQSCGSTSRLFLHESLHDEFLAKLLEKVGTARIGIPTNESTDMGCLVTEKHFNRVMSYIELGKKEGARLVAGGGKPNQPELQSGYFVLPTIFDGVTQSMRLAQEEIFGPVQAVLTWKDEADLPKLANSLNFGLTASIWTSDFPKAFRLAQEIEAGFVWINDASRHFAGVPFGGVKHSGMGREETLGDLLSYTKLKSINVNLG
ncbi:MAG: aldehyde dehydrogenase family protein [Acidobacteria bacterium]|nr:aldehyde dehydrogenase family protein [Acidobacteriota bacterium]